MSTVDPSGAIHDAKGRFAGHVAAEPSRGLEPIGPVAARAVRALRDAAHTKQSGQIAGDHVEPDTYDPDFEVVRENGRSVAVRLDDGTTLQPNRLGAVRIPLSSGGAHVYNLATGASQWRDATDRLHRGDGGPAWRDDEGASWYRHGVRHRDLSEGPAQVHENGEVVFAQDGRDVFDSNTVRSSGTDMYHFEYDASRGFSLSEEYLLESGDAGWSQDRYDVSAYLHNTVPGWQE